MAAAARVVIEARSQALRHSIHFIEYRSANVGEEIKLRAVQARNGPAAGRGTKPNTGVSGVVSAALGFQLGY